MASAIESPRKSSMKRPAKPMVIQNHQGSLKACVVCAVVGIVLVALDSHQVATRNVMDETHHFD